MTGTISSVVVDRGFGFIEPDDKSGRVFFHVKALSDGLPFDETLIRRRVEFDVTRGEKGLRATSVRPF